MHIMLRAGVRGEERHVVRHDDRPDSGHATRRADGGCGPAAARDALLPRDGRCVGPWTGRRTLPRLLRALPIACASGRALRLISLLESLTLVLIHYTT